MNYRDTLKDLRRDSLSCGNRLRSILYDANYVDSFSSLKLPIVANERCGLWYVARKLLTESAYFKSTDGHTNQWRFSLRRLNFHLLPLLAEKNGFIIVDSTRKGKLIPDALLKTVPMWCAVINCILFPGNPDLWLSTATEMVSSSEHHSIAQMIPSFAQELLQMGIVDENDLISRLGQRKPIKPHFAFPGLRPLELPSAENFFNVVCVSASCASLPPVYWQYVQGGGDDHELWASSEICCGNLDADLFWNLIVPESDLDLRVVDPNTRQLYPWLSEGELISRLNAIYEKNSTKESSPAIDTTTLGKTAIIIGAINGNIPYRELESKITGISTVIIVSAQYFLTDVPLKHAKILHFPLESSKKGSKQLRDYLVQLKDVSLEGNIVILCDTGKDLCVGVALCLLCSNYSHLWHCAKVDKVSKDDIKLHLSKILDLRKVNPSRNTLQSVNTYLISGH